MHRNSIERAKIARLSGADLIAGERRRQNENGRNIADQSYKEGELTKAAQAFISMSFVENFDSPSSIDCDHFEDCSNLWPEYWEAGCLERVACPFDALVKAGAMIAAEIDRRVILAGGKL
jgi:hypothetical protein